MSWKAFNERMNNDIGFAVCITMILFILMFGGGFIYLEFFAQ